MLQACREGRPKVDHHWPTEAHSEEGRKFCEGRGNEMKIQSHADAEFWEGYVSVVMYGTEEIKKLMLSWMKKMLNPLEVLVLVVCLVLQRRCRHLRLFSCR